MQWAARQASRQGRGARTGLAIARDALACLPLEITRLGNNALATVSAVEPPHAPRDDRLSACFVGPRDAFALQVATLGLAVDHERVAVREASARRLADVKVQDTEAVHGDVREVPAGRPHVVSTWPARRQHMVSTWSARGQLAVSTASAQRHTVSTRG